MVTSVINFFFLTKKDIQERQTMTILFERDHITIIKTNSPAK